MMRFGSMMANGFAFSYLRNLRVEMREQSVVLHGGLTPSDLLARIRAEAQHLFRQAGEDYPDHRSPVIYAQAALLLSSYRTLSEAIGGRKVAYGLVRDAMLKTGKLMELYMKVGLRVAPNMFERLRKSDFEKMTRRMFGPAMKVAKKDGPEGLDMVMTHCAYAAYFAAQGEPQLTQILCAWDRPWMDAINRSKNALGIKRPATISTGAEACIFRFVETDGATPETEDVVDPIPSP